MGKIAVFGGTKKFFEFLKLTKADVVRVDSVDDAIKNYDYEAMIVLPFYEEEKEKINTFELKTVTEFAKRKLEGFRLYIENYDSFDMYNGCVFGCEVKGDIAHIVTETLCAKGDLQYLSKDGKILQAEGAAYLPCLSHSNDPYVRNLTGHKILLTRGRYLGTSYSLPAEEARDNTMLMRTGSFITSVFAMTNFNRISYKLNNRWKKIFGYVFSYILGVEKQAVEEAFEKVFFPVKTRMDIDADIADSQLKGAYERAVKDAVNWHFDSGIVLGDGTEGSIEMVMSSHGQGLYNNKRVESGMYTGWLLCDAGKYFGREDWVETGKRIFDYFSEKAQLTSGSPYDGFYRFYYNEHSGPNEIYMLDCGRDGIALCNMYRLTGDKVYLERIKRLAEAFVRWTEDDLVKASWIVFTEPYSGNLYSNKEGVKTPAACMERTSFMVMASKILGDDRYLDNVIRIADRLVREYPSFDYHGHTTSSRMARFLFLLLTIQHTGKRDYSALINELLDYLYELKMDCGGIYSEDNLTFDKFNGRPGTYEAGITTVWESDRISDQLYCVNNSLMALSLIKKLPDDTKVNKQKGMDLYNSLLKYILKIQIVDDDKRFNGGWMRAYSMTHKEYYGLNLDFTWGPYCIMAGWIMGILPLTLLSELTDEDFYV